MSDRIYSVPARPQPLDVDLDTLRHQRGLSALKIGVCPARGSDAFVAVGDGADAAVRAPVKGVDRGDLVGGEFRPWACSNSVQQSP
jgi:hypothetical protein